MPLSFCQGLERFVSRPFAVDDQPRGDLSGVNCKKRKEHGRRLPTGYAAMTCRAVCEAGQEAARRAGATLVCSCSASSEPVRILIASQEDLQELGERDLDEVKC